MNIPSVVIQSADAKPISHVASSQPNMSSTILGWAESLACVRLKKSIVNLENVNQEFPFTCMGMIQPFSSKELMIKPEGQRSWRWYRLMTTTAVELNSGEEFTLRGRTYKVMSETPWSRNGFFEYEIRESFE